ncbi:MAG: hypothetical protein NWF00_11040 [Candidatus Bathyarchaeota archaeon]|nr:hypothetical protein [Candidatus Bathyarchaeota archaeon]
MTTVFLRRKLGKAFLFVVVATAVSISFAYGEVSNVETAIASAKSRLLSCYLQAQNAEKMGADMTSLLNTLNEANSLLYAAELAYARNDSASAYELAGQSQSQLSTFASQVDYAMDTVEAQKDQSFWIVVISLAGSFTVIILGIYGWVYMDKKNKFLGEQNDQSQPI